MTARARVDAWLASVRDVWGPSRDSAKVDSLVAETGLSREGVIYALDSVLEHSPPSSQVDALIERAPKRSSVAVILAANVFTAPARAIAWALAQSNDVLVRPSRRATAFLSPLRDHVKLSTLSDDPALEVADMLDSLADDGALHVYGNSSTIEAIERIAKKRTDVRLELHGPGFGAIVARADSIVESADAIAREVAVFDQRGCLSPRVALVIGDAHAAAAALDRELHDLDMQMPRGTLTDSETSEIALALDAARYAGSALVGSGHAVLDLGEVERLTIGPVGRVLPVLSVRDLDHARELLAPHFSRLTTIATDDLRFDAKARIAALGRMQSPPFDGPVDPRV